MASPHLTSHGSMTSIGKQEQVKLAIQSDPSRPQTQPLLLIVSQAQQLTSVIADICGQWGLHNPEQHALKYADPPQNVATSGKIGYITEENRHKLKNGDILRIALKPAIQAKDSYDRIRSQKLEDRKRAIDELFLLSKDYTFALEFIKLNGISLLMSMVENSQLVNDIEIMQLASILGAFLDLMEHSIVSWDSLTGNFVKKLINFVDRSLKQREYFRSGVVSHSLGILESIVVNNPKFYDMIAKEVSVSSPVPFLEKQDTNVKFSTLAFINAMISKAVDQESVLNDLKEKRFNRMLNDHILIHYQGVVPQEISHELYVYQCHIMNLAEHHMKKKFVAGDPVMEDELRMLPVRAFPDEYARSSKVSETFWKQLGFPSGDPRAELMETPPGILALQCMVYLAKTKHDVFTQLLFGHTDNQCPFAHASIMLTRVLCQLFRIGEPPSEIGYEYIPCFVVASEPFKEIYCVTIQLLYKTWKEMRASIHDLEKVMAVVKKQIGIVLQTHSTALGTFEVLKHYLFEISYKKITESEENSQLLEEGVLKSKPVQELCLEIRPEIIQLVREERLRHLCEGASFPKIKRGRDRDQFFYCRLSPNHKVLHFGDYSGNQPPQLEALDKKIQVSDMRLEVGSTCPHAQAKKSANQNIFSLFYEGEEHLDFIAPNETVFNIWIDGLSVLLGKQMQSKASNEDVETLLNMDLKLRLLDIENITIPSQPPAIPKEPTDYDFYYKLDN